MGLIPAPRRGLKLAVFGLLLTLLFLAWRFDAAALLEGPEDLAELLVEKGAWGYLIFLGIYTLLKPLGVPGTLFVIAAPLIWPLRTAFAISMLGTMLTSVLGFAFARFVARDWVAANLPARLRKFEAAIEENSLKTVAILRTIFWMPQMLHYFFGISRVSFWTHFWGSLIGYIPPLLLLTYLGSEMVDASGKIQPEAWPLMAGLILTALLVAAIARSRLSLRAPTREEPEVE